jgi:hypothetical protein
MSETGQPEPTQPTPREPTPGEAARAYEAEQDAEAAKLLDGMLASEPSNWLKAVIKGDTRARRYTSGR